MSRKRMSDVRLEQAVVGACIKDRECYRQIAKIIKTPDAFHTFAHQVVWRALAKMDRDGLPFDPAMLSDVIDKAKMTGDCKPAYLVDLWQSSYSTDVSDHARRVMELFLKRSLADTLRRLNDDLAEPDASPLASIEAAKAKFDKIASLSYSGEADDEGDGRKKFKPFPVEHLPAGLQDFILAAADSLFCDPAFLAVPALVTIASAIGNSRVINIKDSWQEPAVVWAATVADSSSLKSPSLDLAVSPLWHIQKRMSKEYESFLIDHKRAMDEWNANKYAKRGKNEPGETLPPPEKPRPRKLVVNDITIEKLAHVLWENPQGVVLCRDELAGWFASFGRYSDNKGPGADLPIWLEIFRAKSFIVDRRTSDPPTIFVPRAACSVVGTIQPKVLQRILTDDFFDSGLASRLLLCMPPRKAKVWTESTVPEDVYANYDGTIRKIYETGADNLEVSGGEPKRIGFTTAGKNAWIEFYSEWADRQAGSEGEHAYALAKLEAYCARFALLLAVWDKIDSPFRQEAVTEGHVRRSFELVQWFASEADRVYSMIREPAAKVNREKLVDFIVALGGEITPRRLLRSNPSKYRTMDEATKTLESLVQSGLGSFRMKHEEGQPGRPARTFVVKPDTIKT